MARWTNKNFKMSVGDGSGSFSKIGDAMSKKGKYSKKDDPALKLLNNLYGYLETPSIIEDRSSGRLPGLHASSLYNVCARREVLSAISEIKEGARLVASKESHTAGNTFTQDLGHALHEWWQNVYLGPAGLLVGIWLCLKCDAKADGLRPKKCVKCESKNLIYLEYPIHIKDGLDIHGHCDGVVLDTPNDVKSKRRVFELKTKSPSQFPGIHSPERKHVIQVHCYMKGLGLDEAIIVYVNKGKQCSWKITKGQFIAGKPSIKAFLVPFDDKLWSGISDLVMEYHKAKEGISKVLDGSLDIADMNPNDYTVVCESIKCPMARGCAVKDLCFSV